MLLADGSHGNVLAVAIPYGRSKNGSTQENAFAMMPKRAMSEIAEMCLALIKPIMERKVIFWLAAKQPRRPNGVMVGMRHYSNPPHNFVAEHNVQTLFVGDGAGIEIDDDCATQDEFARIETSHESGNCIIHELIKIGDF
jgi:hypothetical protein